MNRNLNGGRGPALGGCRICLGNEQAFNRAPCQRTTYSAPIPAVVSHGGDKVDLRITFDILRGKTVVSTVGRVRVMVVEQLD
jgi:hypothetical protein